MARYKTAFYEPMLSDWRPYETWHEDGAKTATQRATAIWKRILDEYEQPSIDEAIKDEIDAYVALRKE